MDERGKVRKMDEKEKGMMEKRRMMGEYFRLFSIFNFLLLYFSPFSSSPSVIQSSLAFFLPSVSQSL